MSRADVTAELSALVERRLDSRSSFWAREVSFDRGTPSWRRIDYVGFKPHTPGYALEPTSVELGVFACYEIKSCLEDFESGNGLTFYGDRNYLVVPRDLGERLHDKRRLPRDIDQVLCPHGSRLVTLGRSGRRAGQTVSEGDGMNWMTDRWPSEVDNAMRLGGIQLNAPYRHAADHGPTAQTAHAGRVQVPALPHTELRRHS